MEASHSSLDQNGHLLALTSLFEGDFSIDWIVQITEEKISQILYVLEEGTKQRWLTKKGPGTFCFIDLEKQQGLLIMHGRIGKIAKANLTTARFV